MVCSAPSGQAVCLDPNKTPEPARTRSLFLLNDSSDEPQYSGPFAPCRPWCTAEALGAPVATLTVEMVRGTEQGRRHAPRAHSSHPRGHLHASSNDYEQEGEGGATTPPRTAQAHALCLVVAELCLAHQSNPQPSFQFLLLLFCVPASIPPAINEHLRGGNGPACSRATIPHFLVVLLP